MKLYKKYQNWDTKIMILQYMIGSTYYKINVKKLNILVVKFGKIF